MTIESTRATTAPDPEAWREEVEARQRATLKKMFANRKPSPATADFDLPAPNDEIEQPSHSTRGEPDLTGQDIEAAEQQAALYEGDDRECIKTDVMNGFYAGVAYERKRVAGGKPATDGAVPVKDHVLREVVNALRDVAIKYHSTGQLRARLRAELDPLLAASQPAPVARELTADELADPEYMRAYVEGLQETLADVLRRRPAVARELDDRPVYMERCGENSDYWTVITKEEHDSWIEDGFPDKVRAFYSRQATAESAPVASEPDGDALYRAWHKVGADVAGLNFAKFVAALETTESAPASATPTQKIKSCECTRAQRRNCAYCAGYGKERAPSNTSPVGAKEQDK